MPGITLRGLQAEVHSAVLAGEPDSITEFALDLPFYVATLKPFATFKLNFSESHYPTVQTKRYITEPELLQDAYRLGVKIASSGFRPSFIVGLWRGGSAVGIAVQECLQYLGIPTDHIAIRTSYRGLASYQQMVDDPETEIRIHGTQYLLETLNQEDSLLLVDDVFSSGLTASAVVSRLRTRLKNNMPADVRIAVPWYKPARNRSDLQPDFYVHKTDDWLVMPYELSGLTYDEISENKPWLKPILSSLDSENTI